MCRYNLAKIINEIKLQQQKLYYNTISSIKSLMVSRHDTPKLWYFRKHHLTLCYWLVPNRTLLCFVANYTVLQAPLVAQW